MKCSAVRCTNCGQCEAVKQEIKTTFERAIETFGGYNQMVKATEEMSELQKELCKALIGQEDRKHILEELTDVEIMLKQLKLIFNFTEDELLEMKCLKIAKLELAVQERETYIRKSIEQEGEA